MVCKDSTITFKITKKTVINFIKEEMESVKKSEFHIFSIPLEVSVNSGYTWGEAH